MSWAGSFTFGTSWAAFRGRAADNTPHRHATLQIAVGVEGEVCLGQPGGPDVVGRALLVRPNAIHALAPCTHVFLIFLEPQTRLARRLLAAAHPAAISPLPADIAALIDVTGPLRECLDRVEAHLHGGVQDPDPRVRRALAALATASGPDPVAQAADAVGLSPSRLRSLASRHLGAPLSSWLMWRKLERAGQAMAAGASLAEAAADAGFADQAHLTRATRRVFGITPGAAGGVVRPPQAKRTRPAPRNAL